MTRPRESSPPDADLDFVPNTGGSLVISVLRVKDVMRALRCSRSRAYQVIREIRGEPVGLRLAYVLPSQLSAWVRRHAGLTDIPSRDFLLPRPGPVGDFQALRHHAQEKREALRLTLPRTRPRPPGEP